MAKLAPPPSSICIEIRSIAVVINFQINTSNRDIGRTKERKKKKERKKDRKQERRKEGKRETEAQRDREI